MSKTEKINFFGDTIGSTRREQVKAFVTRRDILLSVFALAASEVGIAVARTTHTASDFAYYTESAFGAVVAGHLFARLLDHFPLRRQFTRQQVRQGVIQTGTDPLTTPVSEQDLIRAVVVGWGYAGQTLGGLVATVGISGMLLQLHPDNGTIRNVALFALPFFTRSLQALSRWKSVELGRSRIEPGSVSPPRGKSPTGIPTRPATRKLSRAFESARL
jgi:hypothetical protein